MNLSGVRDIDKAGTVRNRLPFTERGALRLFVEHDSFLGNLCDSVAVLSSHVCAEPSQAASNLQQRLTLVRTRLSARSLTASLVVHCSLVALLIYLPRSVPVEISASLSLPPNAEVIYYRVPHVSPAKSPKMSRARGVRHSGSRPALPRLPVLKTTLPHLELPIVSTPARPDNYQQTIYQATSPPDVKIPEQRLPNIVFEHRQVALAAPFGPAAAKLKQVERRLAAQVAPSLSNSTSPLMTNLTPSRTQPQLAIPLEGRGTLVQRTGRRSTSAGGGLSADAPDIVVLGVNPANPMTQLILPAGNRWGEFAIALPTQSLDAPRRAVRGNGGTGGLNASDGSGAAPNVSAGPAAATINGPLDIPGLGSGGSGGVLDPALLTNMVYPVVRPAIRARRNAVVIAAGPLGGGGLDLYGALKCGKVYSIFLPMPKKDWSLQYCDKSASAQSTATDSPGSVVVFDHPLVPPDVELSHRFNFKRTPLPPNDPNRAIILKGVIAANGAVQHLVVYHGVAPAMDEAARVAFSRWRFKPAMKDGKAIAVEILVGIPL